ncbi:hypothetical protein ACP26L_36115 (plasmid) [Paenibacillus sp. S-38]|uniref:hypothetical protein n=1 Tax=Paenibacillus sp. S-38 TaxID=3416710 RepID=UPI003CEE3D35
MFLILLAVYLIVGVVHWAAMELTAGREPLIEQFQDDEFLLKVVSSPGIMLLVMLVTSAPILLHALYYETILPFLKGAFK